MRSYLSEDETINALDQNRRLIASEIHAQMMAHFWEEDAGYTVGVSREVTELKPCNYTAEQTPRHYRETVEDKGGVRQMLFGGFRKCLYMLQKFDSDSERRFSIILERDTVK